MICELPRHGSSREKPRGLSGKRIPHVFQACKRSVRSARAIRGRDIFRPDDLDQQLLLPPDLQDWLPENHLARFVAEIVGELDLQAIYRVYVKDTARGRQGFHPAMMVSL